MQFLKKYRLNIILILLLTILALWYNPKQQNLYLPTDFETAEKKSTNTLLWTMGIAAVLVLAIALKNSKKIREVGYIFLGIGAVSLPIYLVFKTIFLSGFLVLNSIGLPDQIEKKYKTIFLFEKNSQSPLVYDIQTQETFFLNKVKGNEKLNSLKTGDTVIISFRKGLLGIPFKPEIK